MADARTLDFFGGGSSEGTLTPITGRAPFAETDPALARYYNVTLPAQQTSAYNANYDRNASQASTPLDQLSASLNGNIGGVTGAYNASRAAIGTPNEMNAINGGPTATPATANAIAAQRGVPTVPGGAAGGTGGNYIPSLEQQLASARAAGQAPLGLANQVLGTTGQQAAGLFGAGSGYSVGAPQITTGQTYQTGAGGAAIPTMGAAQPRAGGAPLTVNPQGGPGVSTVPGYSQGGGTGAPAPAPSGVPAFQVGARGAMPGMVQLGAAPTVNGASVGMTNPGAAPGAVMPQLGNGGSGNAFQNSFLGQLQQQINAPQGPSIAAAQLRQAQADNAAQLIGAARSGRGGVGDQAEALREAMAGGSALMSDTAGQLATLRAQEEDMNKNRQLSALGLGGQLAGAQREQDLGYRAQNLGALQGDQSAGLAASGQNLQSQIANQGTQLSLEQLRNQVGLGARAQDLSAAQGNQATQLGARAQDVTARAQDLGALQSDADRQLAAQQLALQGQLGLTGLGLQAQGQGLQYSTAANALGLAGEGMAQDAINRANSNLITIDQGNQNRDAQMLLQQNQLNSQPGFWEQLALNTVGGATNALGGGLIGSLFSGGGAPSAPAAASAPNLYAAPYQAPAPATYSPGSIFNPNDPWGSLYGSGANA